MVHLLKNGTFKEQKRQNYFPQISAVDNTGNVYVIDAKTDKVKKFTTNGTFVKEWNIQRTKASELLPTGISTDNAGNVYVVDDEDDKVKKFTTNGTFVKEWNIQRTKASES